LALSFSVAFSAAASFPITDEIAGFVELPDSVSFEDEGAAED
jgi:hypothetical protein